MKDQIFPVFPLHPPNIPTRLVHMFDPFELEILGKDLANEDFHAWADDELLDAAVQMERFLSLVSVSRARLLAEIDARKAALQRDGLKTARWVAREANTSPAAVGAAVKVGKALRVELDGVADAVIAGEVSYEHARAIVGICNPRNRDRVAAAQRILVADAEGVMFDRWLEEVRQFAELVDEDGPFDPNADLARNRASLVRRGDGTGEVHAELDAERFAEFWVKVNDRADELFTEYVEIHSADPSVAIPSRPTLLALALDDLVHSGRAVDQCSTKAPRTNVTLVLGSGVDGEPHVYDRDGLELPTSILPRHLCDADFRAVIVDSLGMPLDCGRKERYATSAQRQAVIVRDGGCCAFPGCGSPASWLEIHHTAPYGEGGNTDLDLLIGLCRLHHGVCHRQGWRVHRHSDGWHFIQTATGRTFWAQRHHRRRSDPPPPPN